MEESPLFIATRARDRIQKHKIPVIEAFRRYKRSMLMAMLGVFKVVTGGYDFGPAMTSHSRIDLTSFTRSANIEEPALESLAGMLELGEDDSRMISDPGRIALLGSIAVVPIIRKPGRYGLARTLFEILSF